jgi:peptidoglycan/LPS O-acetylase OafA/YrhL
VQYALLAGPLLSMLDSSIVNVAVEPIAGDASTLFNTWQRIAGSFGIGLVAALYAAQARAGGPVAALHTAGLVLVGVAAAGALGALALPALRNTALEY